MIEIELRGFDEMVSALRALPAHVERRAVIDALRAGARVLQRRAKRNVRKHSRQLEQSIVVRTRGRNRVVVMVKRPGSYYAHLIEFGTAPHTIRVREAKALRIGTGWSTREVEHPGARPYPFMRPALDEGTPEALEAMRVKLGKNVERIALELVGQRQARFTRPMRVNPTGRSVR